MSHPYDNRREAGRQLAPAVAALKLNAPLVLALPRGGVPVAAEVARALGAPLDLLLVRKIGARWHPELAVAAVADGEPPQLVCDEVLMAHTGMTREDVEREAAVQLEEIARRRRLYLRDRPRPAVAGREVVVVDDGLATGTTARAGLQALRREHPSRLVLAVPVAPAETVAALRPLVDDLVCLQQPEPFHAVGLHYRDFHQLDDDEVVDILKRSLR